MQVDVRLFATFRIGRFTEQVREYPPGATVAQVLADLAIDPAQVGTAFLDFKYAALDQKLHDGARLGIFPLVGGG